LPPSPPSAPPSLPPDHVEGPLASVVQHDATHTFSLSANAWLRQNGENGDFAKWCASGAGCDGATCSSIGIVANEQVSVAFTDAHAHDVAGTLALCYKFNRGSSPVGLYERSPWREYPVHVAVVDVTSASPRGTGVECSSEITIAGAGFSNPLATILGGASSVFCVIDGVQARPALSPVPAFAFLQAPHRPRPSARRPARRC
jgi:hypothetical protein